MNSVHSYQSSRDPAGVDPSGVDIITGADPPLDDASEDPPILPPSSPTGPPPPTPRRTNSISNGAGYRAPSPVMALLVGNPPPPPPPTTPPPNKSNRASPRRQKQHPPMSPPGDSSMSTGYTSASSPLSHSRQQAQQQQWDEARQNQNQQEISSFLEEKRREALAIYESKDLYMEADEQEEYEQNIAQSESNNSASVVDTQFLDLDENEAPIPVAAMASPRSAATEPHSNKRESSQKASFRKRNSNSSHESVDDSSNHKSSNHKKKSKDDSGDGISKKRRGRIATSGLRSKTPERRGRGQSLERSGCSSPSKEKRGFFRKLFRGKKKSKQDDTVEEGNMSNTEILPPHEKKEKSTVGPRVSFRDEAEQSQNDGSDVHSALSLEVDTRPRENLSRSKYSPAKSDDDVEFGLDTVTSGLTNDMEPERRDIFFAHDEVSTLTAPSAHSYGRRSIDPQEKLPSVSVQSSEPLGRYWNDGVNKGHDPSNVSSPTIDPFTEPFFQEPDGESPITSKRVKSRNSGNKLHVHLPSTLEPAGGTPRTHTNEPSPRGWESPITELKDPKGSAYETSPGRHHSGSDNERNSHQPNKIPSVKKNLPHDLQREPSAFRDGSPYALDEPCAFRDGSPYALDPPLRVHEEDTLFSKSLIGIISERPPKGGDSNRVAAEPPTPDQEAGQQESEPQPPTPIMRPEEDSETKSPVDETYQVDRNRTSIISPSVDMLEEKAATPQMEVSWSGQNRSPLSKTSPTNKMKTESADSSTFLEELFQESIVRPISIADPAKNPVKEKEVDSPSASQAHVIDFHRTQPLSVSPRSRRGNHGDAEKSKQATEATTTFPSKTSDVSSQESQNLSAILQRRRQHISNVEEEEKKEPDTYPHYGTGDEAAPSSRSKMLATGTTALSTAAFMNAQTVRYLHTLNGEPSPRHSWRRADFNDDDYSPIKTEVQRKAVSNMKAVMSKKRVVAVCRSDEAAFDSFISSAPAQQTNGATSHYVSRPKKSKDIHNRNKVGAFSPKSRKTAKKNFKRPVYYPRLKRDVRVQGAPVGLGLDLLRQQRENDILAGRAVPIRPMKKMKQKKSVSSQFQPVKQGDIRDPIQRAGMRLLSKAAIPIQTSARKYLARRIAGARMSAALTLQSYFRRWKCEAYLRAYKHTCTKIQAAFRGSMVRDEISYHHYKATQIQKIVRSYIASTYVYDSIYWVARLQAVMRGKLARFQFARMKQLRGDSALQLQSWYRGCVVRKKMQTWMEAALAIQATYRSYTARVSYQVAVVDIIIVQGLVRQLLARRVVKRLRMQKMNDAACKIQATWRGFQGYTDYIFALVDILVIQRSMRKWLAKNKLNTMRRHRAATKIQAQWRRQMALIGMLYDLVHIIIAQSVIRRFLVQRKLPQKRTEYSKRMQEKHRLDTAARKIQATWRGFWGYSHFIIMQYEIIRLQAIVRGRACRNLFSLKLGCCIMIQSATRRFLSSKKMHKLKIAQVAQGAAVEGMRMRLACQRIQFWWRVVLECNREKSAALVIERFFLMVKTEVDREIRRQRDVKTRAPSRKKAAQRKDYRGEDDEKLLERVWLNTVDEDHVDIFACTSRQRASGDTRRSKSLPRLHPNPSYVSEPSIEVTPNSKGVQHHPSSPTMNLVMRYEDDPAMRRELDIKTRQEEALRASRRYQKNKSKPPPDVTLTRSDERTEVSAITSPTVFKMGKRSTKSSRPKQQPKQGEIEDDFSLEGTLAGEEIQHEPSTHGTGDLKNLHSAPNHSSHKLHFFSADVDTPEEKYPTKKPLSRRHHSTSSIASGSDILSEASDINTHMYSRTATTMTKTTHDETMDSGSAKEDDMYESKSSLDERRYRSVSDKYTSAVSKGKKLLQAVRKDSSNSTYIDHPILSQDSHDNVEVEYVGQQFGMI